MHNPTTEIDKILPQGEMLRGFLEQSFINETNIFELLRMKGVFTFGIKKSDTIPIVITSLISPDEFDFLREKQNTKEDNPKIITQHIQWGNNKEHIIESLPTDFDLNRILDLEYSNYKVVGSPNFVPVENDADHVILEFNIERKDQSKNWASTSSIFPGSLELKRIQDNNQVRLVLTYTANETKVVASETSKNIINHFKNNGLVPAGSDLEKILFKSFTNSNRIEYFWTLTKNIKSSVLEFSSIVDLSFSPDNKLTLPDGIKWMSQKIEDLKIKGESLQETFFIQDKAYHNHILLYGVDCKFKFNIKGLIGACIATIGFPEFEKAKNENAELEVNIKSMIFEGIPKGLNKNELKKGLLKEIESQKIIYYEKLKVA